MKQVSRPPGPRELFRKSLKSESYYSDELINTWLLRPIAGIFVWLVYSTPVTPNMVTVLAILLGLAAGVSYSFGTPLAIAVAGCLILLKDITDDADGQLARTKQLYSRRGRFLDSIGDFVVDVAVFIPIGFVLASGGNFWHLLAALAGLCGITLRVSYHVYYQVSFLHLEKTYSLNRISEAITEEDLRGDKAALWLQRIFNAIYGWQDRLMAGVDAWCRGKNFPEKLLPVWYADRLALRLSGLTGFGTEIALLALCSWFNSLALYLWLNILLMNGIWLAGILYRKLILSSNLK
jgi:phosphatidylglycerophosphate synthase